MSSVTNKTIFISSDHGGFELKNFLTGKLTDLGYNITDLGPETYNPDDDYPDYAKKVGETVSGNPDDSMGILICRNGVGVSVLANKYKNIRCALSWNAAHAGTSRRDDNANCLALPADYINKETALETVREFLDTPFSNEERHIRRLSKYDHSGNI